MKPSWWNDKLIDDIINGTVNLKDRGPICGLCGEEIKSGDKIVYYQDMQASIPTHFSCSGDDFVKTYKENKK